MLGLKRGLQAHQAGFQRLVDQCLSPWHRMADHTVMHAQDDPPGIEPGPGVLSSNLPLASFKMPALPPAWHIRLRQRMESKTTPSDELCLRLAAAESAPDHKAFAGLVQGEHALLSLRMLESNQQPVFGTRDKRKGSGIAVDQSCQIGLRPRSDPSSCPPLVGLASTCTLKDLLVLNIALVAESDPLRWKSCLR